MCARVLMCARVWGFCFCVNKAIEHLLCASLHNKSGVLLPRRALLGHDGARTRNAKLSASSPEVTYWKSKKGSVCFTRWCRRRSSSSSKSQVTQHTYNGMFSKSYMYKFVICVFVCAHATLCPCAFVLGVCVFTLLFATFVHFLFFSNRRQRVQRIQTLQPPPTARTFRPLVAQQHLSHPRKRTQPRPQERIRQPLAKRHRVLLPDLLHPNYHLLLRRNYSLLLLLPLN